ADAKQSRGKARKTPQRQQCQRKSYIQDDSFEDAAA
ncbi:MAG: hypothetical protein RL341_1405, partial [Pseudomonadota bacterium]